MPCHERRTIRAAHTASSIRKLARLHSGLRCAVRSSSVLSPCTLSPRCAWPSCSFPNCDTMLLAEPANHIAQLDSQLAPQAVNTLQHRTPPLFAPPRSPAATQHSTASPASLLSNATAGSAFEISLVTPQAFARAITKQRTITYCQTMIVRTFRKMARSLHHTTVDHSRPMVLPKRYQTCLVHQSAHPPLPYANRGKRVCGPPHQMCSVS